MRKIFAFAKWFRRWCSFLDTYLAGFDRAVVTLDLVRGTTGASLPL